MGQWGSSGLWRVVMNVTGDDGVSDCYVGGVQSHSILLRCLFRG